MGLHGTFSIFFLDDGPVSSFEKLSLRICMSVFVYILFNECDKDKWIKRIPVKN